MSARSSTLPVIALCFLGSALLRSESLAEGASRILAAPPAPVAAPAPAPATSLHGDRSGPQDDPCGTLMLVAKLKEREAKFAKREAALNDRAARLDVVGERVAAMTAQLEKARDALAATVAQVDGAQERDVEHLVTMYATMKPKRAGALFDEMDTAFASELLARIEPENAALILANMEPKNAFTISVMIARRNQHAPKN